MPLGSPSHYFSTSNTQSTATLIMESISLTAFASTQASSSRSIPTDTDWDTRFLPCALASAKVTASIVDVASRVTLSQIFANEHANIPYEAVYRFPLHESTFVPSKWTATAARSPGMSKVEKTPSRHTIPQKAKDNSRLASSQRSRYFPSQGWERSFISSHHRLSPRSRRNPKSPFPTSRQLCTKTLSFSSRQILARTSLPHRNTSHLIQQVCHVGSCAQVQSSSSAHRSDFYRRSVWKHAR